MLPFTRSEALYLLILLPLLSYTHFVRAAVPSLKNVLEKRWGHEADGLNINWARLVNSERRIRKIVARKPKIPTMIQGDVIENGNVVYMASDGSVKKGRKGLKLETWLGEVSRSNLPNDTGVKLNILYEDSVRGAVSTAFRKRPGLKGPIWFHAEVLPGPNSKLNPLKPVDPSSFVQYCKERFSDATISLGWVTHVPRDIFAPWVQKRYRWPEVLDMLKHIKKFNRGQDVNIVFRYIFLGNLTNEIVWLMGLKPYPSITFWNYHPDPWETAPPNVHEAANRARACGDKSRVFFDFHNPHALHRYREQYSKSKSIGKCPSSSAGRQSRDWNHKKWRIFSYDVENPDILVNDYGAIFMGDPRSLILSETHVQGPNTSTAIPNQQIRGKVHFVDSKSSMQDSSSSDYPDPDSIPKLTVHLRDKVEHVWIHPVEETIRVELDASGQLYIEDARDPSVPPGERPRSKGEYCRAPCYEFFLNDYGDKVFFSVRMSDKCTGMDWPDMQAARGAKSKTISLEIKKQSTSQAQQDDKSRRKRSAKPTNSANYVLVQKGDGDNRFIVEDLLHHELTDQVQKLGFGSSASNLTGHKFLCINFISLLLLAVYFTDFC